MRTTGREPTPALNDRLAPTRRPRGLPAGYQEWRRLLFLHWPVPPEALRPLVPAPLALDLFEGMAYVGLIPFCVQAARPLGVPRILGLNFLETNVRTYVHVDGREPGVYFFSLDAASLLATIGARLTLGLPYFIAQGRERVTAGRVVYALRRRSGARPACGVRYEIGAPLGAAVPGTLEHFLIERYLLHAVRGPSRWTVQVHHPPYPLQRARLLALHDELRRAAGIPPLDGAPLVHYAAGVDVEIFAPRIARAPGFPRP
jgi:uncharacterized protein YqjF (DUF2071 family)